MASDIWCASLPCLENASWATDLSGTRISLFRLHAYVFSLELHHSDPIEKPLHVHFSLLLPTSRRAALQV